MVEVLGNLGVGLGVAVVKLVAVVLAKRLGIDTNQRGSREPKAGSGD